MADNTIDTLSIQINSTSQGVTKSVNSVIGSLEKLSGSLSRLSGASFNFKNVETGINQLNLSLNRLDTQSITNASTAIRSLSGATASLNRAMSSLNANAFSTLATGLQNLLGAASVAPDLSSLTNLSTAMSKLGGKGSTQGISNLSSLSSGLRSLSGLSVPDIPNLDGLASLISVFNKLGGKRGTGASTNFKPMVDGLKELSRLSGTSFPDASSLMALANAFSAFGRSTSASAIANIPQLATAFRNLMVTLSSAPTVSRNVIDLANALANLASQGGRVGTATDSMTRQIRQMTSILEGIGARSRRISGSVFQFGRNLLISGKNATSAGRSYSNLASKIGLLYAKFWLLLRAVRALNGMISVASALTEVQNVVDTTFGQMSYKIEDFSKNAIKNFGLSELAAKQYASRFQAMGNAMGITGQQVAKAQELISTKKTTAGLVAGYNQASNSMADMSINLTKLTADMASFYDVEQSTVAKALQSGVMAGQTRPLRQYGIDLTNATLSEWAMNNGLNANIKSMTQAEKAMLRYQYVMAQTTNAQGDFTRTARRSKRAA